MQGVILVGSSDTSIKSFDVDTNFEDNVYIVNKTNWINNDIYNDVFEITIKNGKCTCKRLDLDRAWGIELLIYANISVTNNCVIPVFFINLEKDKDRLVRIQSVLAKIFDKEQIHRVEGVNHKLGLEGCRLAHIKANICAINNGYNYYIIAEDDIQPLVDNDKIMEYINNSILYKPDLVLFEQGDNERPLENKIQLTKISETMYRIYAKGNNAGCYLCSRNFGIELIKHWMKNPNKHLDSTWQDLWPSNKVYFHRPQLFHQSADYSNQNHIMYRKESVPFDWNLYESL